MKKTKLASSILLFMLCIAFTGAFLEASDIKVGSDTQRRGEYAETIITITNKGDLPIQNLEASFSGVLPKYSPSLVLSATTIPINESVQLTVRAFVPLDLHAVDTMGRKISVNIGNLVLSGRYSNGTSVTRSLNIQMEAENRLEFASGSQIIIADTTRILRDGREYKAKRGDSIQITAEVRNRYDRTGDCTIDATGCDIEDVEATIESRDYDLDIEKDLFFGTVRPERTAKKTISFSIPNDVEDYDYDVDFWITGLDENGARHGQLWRFVFAVEVPDDEITITNLELIPQALACDQKQTTLYVTIKNTGRDDQDNAAILIESSRLDIKDSIYRISLNEGRQVTRTFSIRVPEGTLPGQYFIHVTANVNHNQETDMDAATLIINECRQQPPQPPADDEKKDDKDDTIKIIDIPPTGGVIYSTPKKQSFFDSTEYVLLLGGLFFIAILMLFILLAVLLKR